MTTHFATVPVEIAVRAAKLELEPPLPLALVVDDEALIVHTLVSILNGHGLATVPALDASTALEMARLAPPDVLITDVKMPCMDGFELACEVSKIAPDCDIILLSGEPSTFNRAADCRARGFDFVVMVKPVHPTDLLACVFELLSMRGWLVPEVKPSREANPSDLIFLDSFYPGHRKSAPAF
jgi:CheY-like chemotaxis protein